MREQSAFEVEMVTEKLKRHKNPGTDKIPAEMVQAEGRSIRSEIHGSKNQSLYVFITRVIKLTVGIIYIYIYIYIYFSLLLST